MDNYGQLSPMVTILITSLLRRKLDILMIKKNQNKTKTKPAKNTPQNQQGKNRSSWKQVIMELLIIYLTLKELILAIVKARHKLLVAVSIRLSLILIIACLLSGRYLPVFQFCPDVANFSDWKHSQSCLIFSFSAWFNKIAIPICI